MRTMHNTPVRKAIVGRQLNPGLTVLRTIPAVIGLGLLLTAGVYGSASAPQQTLTPGADDFTVDVTPAASTISPGGEVATFTVTVRRINGFNRTIFLSVETNRPDEARASFDPALAWFSPGGRDQAKLEVYYQPLYGRPSISPEPGGARGA